MPPDSAGGGKAPRERGGIRSVSGFGSVPQVGSHPRYLRDVARGVSAPQGRDGFDPDPRARGGGFEDCADRSYAVILSMAWGRSP